MTVRNAIPERRGATERAPPAQQYGLTMPVGGLSLVLGLGLGVSPYQGSTHETEKIVR